MATIYAESTDGSCGALTSNWDDVHDGASAKNTYFTATHRDDAVRVAGGVGYVGIFRVFMAFDTSGISVAPESATLKIYGTGNNTTNMIGVKATHDPASVDANTFNDLDGWTAGYGSGNLTAYTGTISAISSWNTSGYNDITLNSTALSDMAANSYLKIALLAHPGDYSDSQPVSSDISTGMYFTQETGTSKDPYIDYTAAAAAASPPTKFTISSGTLKIKGGNLKLRG